MGIWKKKGIKRSKKIVGLCLAAAGAIATLGFGANDVQAANPYMSMWEHVPDGEPHVFGDRVYVYGSHDVSGSHYCSNNYVCWSAPVDDLTEWEYEGVIFETGGPDDSMMDTLLAPDACQGPDGRYYMYLFGGGVGGAAILVSDDPAGPFEIYADGKECEFGFDPAVLVDDDNSVYVYSGSGGSSTVSKMDSDMKTVLEKKEMLNTNGEAVERFYEASSIRKVGDKYVYVYSAKRVDEPGFVPQTDDGRKNGYRGTLEYSYSDDPMGPWTYGGIIINNGGEILSDTERSYYDGNNHGGIEEINGEWYVFYHRQTGTNEFSRQGMIEKIDVSVEDGKVIIPEAEMTSQGAEYMGLESEKKYQAAITCYLTKGAYVSTYRDSSSDYNPIVNIKDGVVDGYKYINFNGKNYDLTLDIMPKGQSGTISVKLDDPNSDPIAEVNVEGDPSDKIQQVTVNAGEIEGQHAVFFTFAAEGDGEICEFNAFEFKEAPKNGWLSENGKWFYYENNNRVTGWLQDGETWYYLQRDGEMATGWIKPGNNWYYLRANGAMATGWIKEGSSWYYLSDDGAMKTGWLQDGKAWYYLKGSGAMATGWLQDGKNWYYLKSSGAMATGWQQEGRTWYYLKSSGAMATGWQQDGRTWYYLKSSGAMATGWQQDGKTWYYLKSSGAMATGWLQDGRTWYYLKSSGAMATGWVQAGGKWYYLRSNGAMAYNTWIGKYYVNGSGAWTKTK